MKKAAFLLAGAFFALTAAAQNTQVVAGNGHYTEQERTVEAFEKLQVTGNFEVKLVSGQPGIVTIEGDENIIDIVTTGVKDGILTIATADNKALVNKSNRRIKVTIPFEHLNQIAMTGPGSITSRKTLGRDVKIMLDGPGHIKACIKAHSAEALVLGSGTIELTGTSENFKCKVAGSGAVKAHKLDTVTAEAVVSGSGEAGVVSTKSIKGRISGSGNIAFSGDPAEQDLKRMGSGEFVLY